MPRVIAPVFVFALSCLAQTTGSVTGVVVDRITGAAIPGVAVTVYERTTATVYEGASDASGEFRFFGMKRGTFEVRFEKEGYRSGNKIPPQPYAVGQGQDPIRIRLEMTRLSTLSGRVLDPDGNPVSQADVKIVGRNTFPVGAGGTFTVKELEPGSYKLAAIPKSVAAPEGDRRSVPTYAPQPVVIRGDGDVSGYEIRLETAEVYRVSGTLLDETGSPKAGVPVQLMPTIHAGPRIAGFGTTITVVGPSTFVGPEEARVVSREDGSFEFPAVRAGEWQLAAMTAASIDTVNYLTSIRSGALTVVVSGRNLDNLQLRFGSGFKLTGSVDWGGSPVRRTSISLHSLDGQSNAAGISFFDGSDNLSIDRVSPGKHLILPQPPPGYYPASVQMGGQDVLGKPVDLFPGSPPLRIVFKPAAGSVHGRAEGSTEDVTVVLLPLDVQTIGYGQQVRLNSTGVFDVNGVPPGEYRIAAIEHFITNGNADSEWLAKFASIGTRISVAVDPVTVPLRVTPFPD